MLYWIAAIAAYLMLGFGYFGWAMSVVPEATRDKAMGLGPLGSVLLLTATVVGWPLMLACAVGVSLARLFTPQPPAGQED